MSSALDLNARVVDVTVCGISSSLVQVTVVPAFTVSSCGLKVKLAILTWTSAARAPGEIASSITASAPLMELLSWRVIPNQPCSGVSIMASRCSFV